MKISGFPFVRNGIKLYYQVVEAIMSILPICDKFVVAVAQADRHLPQLPVVETYLSGWQSSRQS